MFRKGDVLLVSLEIPLDTAIRAIRRGFDAGMSTILNPAPAPTLPESGVRELLKDVVVLTPNRVEAMALAGIASDAAVEPDWGECGLRLKEMGAACVIVTLGSRGCQIVAAMPLRPIPAPRVEAVDTVGAGDAFNGALAVALAEDRSTDDAAAWAVAAAALAVTRPGRRRHCPTATRSTRWLRIARSKFGE